VSALLPWQQPQWDNLQSRIAQDNLPHALLLTGRRGVGKLHFARQLGERLLCSDDQPAPCGQCKGCRLISAGTHPDLKVIQPPQDKSVISVDQIRELTHYLSLTSLCGGYQVVLISPADAMNVNAANSLLKTLEEPPANTLLLLMSDRPSALTATIRSRCQVINFEKPAHDSALAWLKNEQPALDTKTANTVLELADGAPLRAADMVTQGALNQRTEMLDDLEQIAAGRCDPIEIAKKWLKLGKKESLYWVYGWLVDMVRMKVANQPPYIANADIASRLSKIAATIELPLLYKRLDQVSEALRLADNPSLNAELLLEGVLIGWTPRR